MRTPRRRHHISSSVAKGQSFTNTNNNNIHTNTDKTKTDNSDDIGSIQKLTDGQFYVARSKTTQYTILIINTCVIITILYLLYYYSERRTINTKYNNDIIQ